MQNLSECQHEKPQATDKITKTFLLTEVAQTEQISMQTSTEIEAKPIHDQNKWKQFLSIFVPPISKDNT